MNKRRFATGAVSIALAVTMLSTTAFAASVSFTDVDSNHWAAPSITEMADRGVMTGVGDNRFAPDKTLTYAEFITMVVRQFYEDKIGGGGDTWYAPYMSVAETIGILTGTNVSAEATINRYDMAQIMYNVMKEQKMSTSSLSDTSKVADWASVPAAYQDAVSVCYNMGMLSGVDGKGTFNGNGVMTRAQAAVVMDRLIGNEQGAPPATGEIPAGAKVITEMSQLTNTIGVEACEGGFHLNPDLVLYGSSGLGFETTGYSRVTFTFEAGSADARITANVQLTGSSVWDAAEKRGIEVVSVGETRTLSFDCSGSTRIGFDISEDSNGASFVEGWITDIYLT